MKKTVFAALAALLVAGNAFAQEQEETPAKFKLYGFIRNFTVLDTREVNGGTHDLYFYMPKDRSLNAEGIDLNEGLNWKSISLTTRIGLDVSGYQIGAMKIGGKVEADFYSLNGTGTANTIAQFRLRQAFMGLSWGLGEGSFLLLNIGQTWHPMAADMPHVTNLETGAPFNPFNRSPQIMAHYTVGGFTLTGGLLYLSQYLPMDAQAGAKSVAPYKYGFPEAYLGIAYKGGPFLVKAGVDLINTKPIRTVSALDADGKVTQGANGKPNTWKANGILTALSPYVFVQYTSGKFQLRAKSILAQSAEHMNLLSGYGIASYTEDSRTYSYTPMQDWASFVSFQYGKKVQVMAMAGYMKQLGTTQDLLDPSKIWINTAADTKIQQAFRVTPTLAWNIGKFTLSLEYDFTYAQYGEGARNARGLYSQYHWLGNHRVINMVKFNF